MVGNEKNEGGGRGCGPVGEGVVVCKERIEPLLLHSVFKKIN
jgi:hypothetical protein